MKTTSFVFVLLLGLAAAMAQSAEPEDGNVLDEAQAPISIESDQPSPPPTEQQLRRQFREALGARVSAPEERLLGDGTLEITTQVGRFCAKPSPGQSQSGVGGNVTLAAPCTQF
jgi:hypothetical protein